MTNKIFLLNGSVKQKQYSPTTGAGGADSSDEGLRGVCTENSGSPRPHSRG